MKGHKHEAWLSNYGKAQKWARKYDILQALERGGGLVKYSNFLPEEVAEGLRQDLLSSPDSCWLPTYNDNQDAQNKAVSHTFMSTKTAKGVEAISRVLSLLLPESLHVFSAAKYTQSDHIDRHDDRAYTQVKMEDGAIIECSRDIAVIVYLTKDWKREQGGILIDLGADTPTEYVPEFNSAIIFRIPRWHAVTPVRSPDQPRLSIFGWFLVPGHKYALGGEESQAQASKTPGSNKKGSSSKRGSNSRDDSGKGKKRSKHRQMAADDGGGHISSESPLPAWQPGDGSILRLVPKDMK